MATPPKPRKATGSRHQAAKTGGSQRQQGIYVYGIVPAEAELAAEVPGVGDPPGRVRLARYGDLAALISEVNLAGPLGTPDDLRAHMAILDATAAELPVLPVRFGAVVASEDAVATELLAAGHDEFAAALHELEGRAEFVAKGRYAQQVVLGEVLAENKRAARLADQIRGVDPDATRHARIELGQIINAAITAKRERDTRALGQVMHGHCVASVVREPTHELDAVHAAFLAGPGEEPGMRQVIEDLARAWEGRIELRRLGPMAAYDFAATTPTAGTTRTC